jgi:hypothetical protein
MQANTVLKNHIDRQDRGEIMVGPRRVSSEDRLNFFGSEFSPRTETCTGSAEER